MVVLTKIVNTEVGQHFWRKIITIFLELMSLKYYWYIQVKRLRRNMLYTFRGKVWKDTYIRELLMVLSVGNEPDECMSSVRKWIQSKIVIHSKKGVVVCCKKEKGHIFLSSWFAWLFTIWFCLLWRSRLYFSRSLKAGPALWLAWTNRKQGK